jgi:hypothetical protein
MGFGQEAVLVNKMSHTASLVLCAVYRARVGSGRDGEAHGACEVYSLALYRTHMLTADKQEALGKAGSIKEMSFFPPHSQGSSDWLGYFQRATGGCGNSQQEARRRKVTT